MRGKSFSIALAAVSCALATIFMYLGINIPVLILTGYVFGSVSLMLPLAKDFRLGGFLAYLATCLLCLAFGGIPYFYRLFPFVAFFGLHPLVNVLQKRYKIKKWIAFPIKAIWFDAMLCCTVLLLFSFNTDFTLPFDWLYDWIYPIVIVAGTAIFFAYDWVMFRFQNFANYYVGKIERGRGKKDPPPAPSGDSGQDDVFGYDAPAGDEPSGTAPVGGSETGGETAEAGAEPKEEPESGEKAKNDEPSGENPPETVKKNEGGPKANT